MSELSEKQKIEADIAKAQGRYDRAEERGEYTSLPGIQEQINLDKKRLLALESQISAAAAALAGN